MFNLDNLQRLLKEARRSAESRVLLAVGERQRGFNTDFHKNLDLDTDLRYRLDFEYGLFVFGQYGASERSKVEAWLRLLAVGER